MNVPSPWRADKGFCELAGKHWPLDYRKALEGGYAAMSPTTRLMHRWQCWMALRDSLGAEILRRSREA